jgi:hypothetical protein
MSHDDVELVRRTIYDSDRACRASSCDDGSSADEAPSTCGRRKKTRSSAA